MAITIITATKAMITTTIMITAPIIIIIIMCTILARAPLAPMRRA